MIAGATGGAEKRVAMDEDEIYSKLEALLARIGFDVVGQDSTANGVEIRLRRPDNLDPERYPEVDISSAGGSDRVEALRNALHEIWYETMAQVGQFGWKAGTTKVTTYGTTLVLRPWPMPRDADPRRSRAN